MFRRRRSRLIAGVRHDGVERLTTGDRLRAPAGCELQVEVVWAGPAVGPNQNRKAAGLREDDAAGGAVAVGEGERLSVGTEHLRLDERRSRGRNRREQDRFAGDGGEPIAVLLRLREAGRVRAARERAGERLPARDRRRAASGRELQVHVVGAAFVADQIVHHQCIRAGGGERCAQRSHARLRDGHTDAARAEEFGYRRNRA